MQSQTTIRVILTIAAGLVLLIAALFAASIIRRFFNARKYRKLDLLREVYAKKIRLLFASGDQIRAERELTAAPKSSAWRAIEDVLLTVVNEEPYQEWAKQLFTALGYVSFYERQSGRRNVQMRALCIDKLGKMQSLASVPKLVALLDEDEPELVSVALRSLSKIGGRDGLTAVIARLPTLINKGLVASKALETALLAFGVEVIPFLTQQHYLDGNPRIAVSVLKTLSHLPADPRSVQPAIEQLARENPEVRSSALKALGRPEHLSTYPELPERIISLLHDPVWYVRLQAIRSLSSLGHKRSSAALGELLRDEKWQVRNEAARALILLGEGSLDILLDTLTSKDPYARDSVCEEIENTNFSLWLIERLVEDDALIRVKSRRILETMRTHGFSTPLLTYWEQGASNAIKQRVGAILKLPVDG